MSYAKYLMSYIKPSTLDLHIEPQKDDQYCNAFIKQYVNYLESGLAQKSGAAWKNVNESLNNNNIILTRVFDDMKLPIMTKEEMKESTPEGGAFMDVFRLTLEDIAEALFDQTKSTSAVNSLVVNALGIDNYAKLTGGEVVDGIVQAKEGREGEFIKKEKQIAEDLLKSVVVNYSQSLAKCQLTETEKEVQGLSLNLGEAKRQLMQAIAKCQGTTEHTLKNLRSTDWSQVEMFQSSEDYKSKTQSMMEHINGAVKNDSYSEEELMELYEKCNLLYLSGDNYIKDTTRLFETQFGNPMSALSLSFTLDDFYDASIDTKDDEEALDTIEGLIAKIEILEKLLEDSKADSSLNEVDKQALADVIESCQNELSVAMFWYEQAQNPDDPTTSEDAAGKMRSNLDSCINMVLDRVENVNQTQVEPSKPLANIFLRILRAIIIWRLISKDEAADIQRAEIQTKLLNDLVEQKQERMSEASETSSQKSVDEVMVQESIDEALVDIEVNHQPSEQHKKQQSSQRKWMLGHSNASKGGFMSKQQRKAEAEARRAENREAHPEEQNEEASTSRFNNGH